MTDAYILQNPEGAEKAVRVQDCRHFITTDWAISEKKRADYSVFALWALTPDRDLLCVSRFRDRIEEADHIPTLQRFYDDSRKALGGPEIRLVAVEKQSFGLTVLKNGRRHSSMPLQGMPADQDKFSRAIPVAGFVSGGNYYLPAHADWTAEWISEHTSFPTGKHDDTVDCSAYAGLAVERYFPGTPGKGTKTEATESGVDPRMQANIDKIAKRNAKERRRNPWR